MLALQRWPVLAGSTSDFPSSSAWLSGGGRLPEGLPLLQRGSGLPAGSTSPPACPHYASFLQSTSITTSYLCFRTTQPVCGRECAIVLFSAPRQLARGFSFFYQSKI